MSAALEEELPPVIIRREPVPIELVRPSFYGMLVLYYCGITTYGATSTAFVSPALTAAGGGHEFAFLWAVVVTVSSALAVVGVILSRRLEFGWIEFGSTLVLIATLAGYTAALLARGLTIPEAAVSIPLAWLPLILSVMPAWRLLVMSQDGTVIFKRLKRRQLHPLPPRRTTYR